MTSSRSLSIEVTESDLIHEQLRESPFKRWLLLDGNRYMITGLFSGIVFIVCFSLGVSGFIPVMDPGTATTLVGAIVGGTLPFITIVLAINQLVLSQELGWPGGLMQRFDGMRSLRGEVEELTGGSVSPAAPADFLQLLMRAITANAETLQAELPSGCDPVTAELVDQLVRSISEEARVVDDTLETASLETFDALSAVLGHFNGAHLYIARRIRTDNGEALPREAIGGLDTIIDLLGYLAVARQTFKTLYMQHELAHLSKLLLYVGFPTLLGGGIFMMIYPELIAAIGAPFPLVVIVSAVVTLVFLPFIVLLSYTFRIATVASRTADFGPFVPRAGFETRDDSATTSGGD